MKLYNTQAEVDNDIIDLQLSIDDDVGFTFDVCIKGDIKARNIKARNIKAHNIKASNIEAYNIKAHDIKACDIKAYDIDAQYINASNIDVYDIDASNIIAHNIDAHNINYYAFCSVYGSIKCNSWRARRDQFQKPFCLDGELTINKPKVSSLNI